MSLALPALQRPWRRYLPVLAISLLAWISLWRMGLEHLPSVAATAHAHTEGPSLLVAWLMWCGMALAMMLPTALPALATLEELTATARERGVQSGRPGWFVAGFMLVWFTFGLLAAFFQASSPAGGF